MSMETDKQEWFYSTDGENYIYFTIEDAINGIYNDYSKADPPIGSIVYCGVGIKPNPSELCNAEDIIETMRDRAWDWGGEHAQDFPNVSKAAIGRLDALLNEWYNEYVTVDFWQIDTKTIKEYIITEEDIKERE